MEEVLVRIGGLLHCCYDFRKWLVLMLLLMLVLVLVLVLVLALSDTAAVPVRLGLLRFLRWLHCC